MRRLFQSVAIGLVVVLLAGTAAALVRCASQLADEKKCHTCPLMTKRAPRVVVEAGGEGAPCCRISSHRPAPAAAAQAPELRSASAPQSQISEAAPRPAITFAGLNVAAPPILSHHSQQALLCTFLI
jgi:hypothetical protein